MEFPRGLKVWSIFCIVVNTLVAVVNLLAVGILYAVLGACMVAGYIIILRKKKIGFYIVCGVTAVTLIANIAYGVSIGSAITGVLTPIITWLLMRNHWEMFE